ncbi:site-specific integrase [Azospirillum formosense]|uniref:site-specific integrase n=1 Tax=Azospirillum formosense TaxID=861533 RepID=UPI00338EC749
MSSYLKRKGDRMVFRRRIPQCLIARFGRSELAISLGDLGPRAARAKARALAAQSDELFSMVSRNLHLSPAEVTELARRWFASATAENEERLQAIPPGDSARAAHERQLAEDDRESTRVMLADNQWPAASAIADRLLADAGIEHWEGEEAAYRDLCRMILRASAQAAEIHLARLKGDYSATPSDPVFIEKAEPVIVRVEVPNPPPAEAPAPTKSAPKAPLFSTAVTSYTAEKNRAGEWRGSTEHQYRRFYELFSGFLGDQPVNAYTRADIGRWVEALQQIPSTYGQSTALRGKTLKELVAYTAANPSVEPVTARTVQKHTIALSGFFGWCRDRGHIDDNPVTRSFRYKKDRRAREQRAAWEAPELNKLFSSPIWTGCKSESRRSAPGTLMLSDALFWIPLIAVFSGMRLEEIAALRVEDVQTDSGIAFFDITPAGGKLLKTAAAVRRVPVHKELVDVGFLRYVEQQRRAKVERLFPELQPGGPDKRFGFYPTKKLSRYFDAVGILDLDVHGFRHAAITGLQRAEVAEPIIRDLVGHEGSGSETHRYSKGYPLPQLADALNRLAYPGLQLDHLKL